MWRTLQEKRLDTTEIGTNITGVEETNRDYFANWFNSIIFRGRIHTKF